MKKVDTRLLTLLVLFTFSTTIHSKDSGLHTHHPIDIEIKQKIDLPLKNGNLMFCDTCHKEHSVKDSKVKKKYSISEVLRKEYRALCVTCHADKAHIKVNHLDLNIDQKSKKMKQTKIISCQQCHYMHDSNKTLTRNTHSKLCLSCHKEKKNEMHKDILSMIMRTNRVKGVKFEDKHLVCTTCHDPHGRPFDQSFVRDRYHILVFCSSCHGQKITSLFDKYHSRIRKTNSKRK